MRSGERIGIILACVILIFGLLNSVFARSDFKAGRDYYILKSTSHYARQDGKVIVYEFFSYACPACYGLEPIIAAWVKQKPTDVKFKRVPVVFRPHWRGLAKAYYVARSLGVEGRMSPVLFNAIHRYRMSLNSTAQLAELFQDNGITKQRFMQAYENSRYLDAKLAVAHNMTNSFGIDAVPSIVVDGKYKTNFSMVAGNPQRFIKLINYLAKKAKNN